MATLPMPAGLDTTDLECVMLDVAPFDIERAMGDAFNPDDLFYGDIPRLKYAQGAVAETDAHLTLLFGIHPNDRYEEAVWVVLDGWDFPQLLIDEVSFFPSSVEGQDYNVVVARVVPSQSLLAGRERLKVLPHTETFPTYKPHITLAYIKGSADLNEWVSRLNSAYAHTFVDVSGLNLGID